MKLMEDKIKQIEQVAIGLKKWADKQSYNPPSTTKVQLTPSWRYKKVIMLLLEKTNVGAKVEKDFAALDQLHQDQRYRLRGLIRLANRLMTIDHFDGSSLRLPKRRVPLVGLWVSKFS